MKDTNRKSNIVTRADGSIIDLDLEKFFRDNAVAEGVRANKHFIDKACH